MRQATTFYSKSERPYIRRLLVVAVLLVSASCSAVTKSPAIQFSGVWQIGSASPNYEREFSWGTSPTFLNSALEIDLGADPPTIRLPAMGLFEIESWDVVDQNAIELTFHFDRGGFDVTYRVNYDSQLVWVDVIKGEALISTGEENPYMWVGGPSGMSE